MGCGPLPVPCSDQDPSGLLLLPPKGAPADFDISPILTVMETLLLVATREVSPQPSLRPGPPSPRHAPGQSAPKGPVPMLAGRRMVLAMVLCTSRGSPGGGHGWGEKREGGGGILAG